jgi:hypothetical protein
MKSKTNRRFKKCAALLPEEERKNANEAFKQFILDPYHPGLHFKRVHSSLPVFSVRISLDYRAVGIIDGDEIIWFWIGSHAEYEKILKSMK